MTKISVIIPVYNASEFLQETYKSIKSQTLPANEIIFIDDGSNDNSLDILKEMSSEDNSVSVYTQENQGPSFTRNKGVDLAKNEILCFVDADDILHPQRLEVASRFIDDADIVLTDFLRFDTEKNELPKPNISYNDNVEYLDPLTSAKTLIKGKYGLPSTIIKKSIYQKVGGLKRDLKNCEDYELFFRMLAHGASVKYVKANLYHYRNHSSNSLSKDSDATKNAIRANLYMLDTVNKLPQEIQDIAKFIIGSRIVYRGNKIIAQSDCEEKHKAMALTTKIKNFIIHRISLLR